MARRIIRSVFNFKPFSIKQLKILTWWLPNSPVKGMDGIIADGSVRSGKTVAMSLSFVMWAMDSFNNENFGMCGKTIGAFRRNVLMVLKLMLWSRGYKYIDHRNDNLFEVRHRNKLNYFYIFGGKDERSQDLIQGITLAGILLDDAALMPESFVEQGIARCSVEDSKFWINCNPNRPNHWLKVNWVDKVKEKNIIYLHFTMDDNLSLSEKVKARYRSLYTGTFFKRYVLGLWVSAEGAVYTQFTEEPEAFIKDEAPPINYAVIGVDFGGSKSAHAFSLTGFTHGFREVIHLDEYYHKSKTKRLNPDQLNTEFVKFVRRAKAKYRVYEAYCDSAEQTLMEGLRTTVIKEHLGVEIKNALKMEINERIAFYNSLMAQGRFFIMRHCKHTIEALQDAVYDEKKQKDVRLDDGTTNIDSLDSMEYSTESVQENIMYLDLRN